MLSYEVSYLGIVVRVLGLVELQVQWIVEQVDLLLTYLGNDIQRLMVLVDQHVNYLVRDFGWEVCVLCDLPSVLQLELLVHGLGELDVVVFRSIAGELLMFRWFASVLADLGFGKPLLIANIFAIQVPSLLILGTLGKFLLVILNLNVTLIKMLHEYAESAFFVSGSILDFIY